MGNQEFPQQQDGAGERSPPEPHHWRLERALMDKIWLRFRIAAPEDSQFVAMFEPLGQTYNLAAGEYMFADVYSRNEVDSDSGVPIIELDYWAGGMSISPPGHVITRNADGEELDRLN